MPKAFISFGLNLFGFIISIPFCTNWGFVLFDVIDHYLCTYLLFLVGLFQCFGCAWSFDVEKTMTYSEGHKKSLQYLTFSFWIYLLIVGIVFVLTELIPVGIIVMFVGLFLFILIPSFYISKLPFQQWYAEVALCGVRRIGYSMTKMGRDGNRVQWWEGPFVQYWAIAVKYVIPSILWFLLVNNTKDDIDKTYGGYAAHWQAIGMVVPILGLVTFLANICFWLHDE